MIQHTFVVLRVVFNYDAHVENCTVLFFITFRVRHSQGEMYIGHGRLSCVCLSHAAFLHCCVHPDVTFGNGRGASSCALLGGFAIGARFRCCDSICIQCYRPMCSANACQSLLLGQLPVKFNDTLHQMQNVSKCHCTRFVAGC